MGDTKYHIGKNGPARCTATKRACQYGGGEMHFESQEEAEKVYQARRDAEGAGSDVMVKNTKKPTTKADGESMMSENELKAVMDVVNRRVEVVVPDGLAVMVNGIRMAPTLGTEQNPARHPDDLPEGTGLVVYEDGDKHWYKNSELHREDGPAIERTNGDKFWYLNGKCHREDGPAIEYSNGSKFWYLNGECHCDNGPAAEWADGDKEYWVHGDRMTEAEFIEWSKGTPNTTDSAITPDEFPVGSEQNPAKHHDDLPEGTGLVVDGRGSKFWFLNGEPHREDGPAIEWANGSKEWWVNGVPHREDGPAVEGADGDKEYWVHGEYMTEAEFKRTRNPGSSLVKIFSKFNNWLRFND